MRFLRAVLTVLLFLWPIPATAQARPPELGEIPDAQSLEVPYFYPRQNALERVDEWTWPGRYLYLRNNLNWLLPGVRDLAPRLYFRTGSLDVSAGSQLLVGATPFHDAMSFQGARLASKAGNLTWTLWGGQTENVDEQLLSGISNPHDVFGATVGWRPDAYHSWGLSVMPYASASGGSVDRTLAMVQGYYSDRATYGLRVAYGQDLGGGPPGAGPSTRRAWRATGSYAHNRINASVDLLDYGRLFGPPQGIVDLRGQLSVNALAQYRFDRDLVWTEIYRQNGFESPGADSVTRSSITTLQHRLSWYPDIRTRIEGGFEHTTGGVTGSPSQSSNSLFIEGSGYVGSILLAGDGRRDRLPGGVNRTQIRLRSSIPLGLDTSLFLEQALFDTRAPAGGFDHTWQTNVGVRALFPEDRGYLQAQYLKQVSTAGGGLSEGDSETGALSLMYRPIGRLFVGGSLNLTQGAGAAATFLEGRARWLFNRHEDLQLSYNFRTGGQTFFVDGQLRQLENTVSLTWRHSFGGPIQSLLQQDLLGRLVVQLQATPAGGTGRALPLPGVAFAVAGRHPRTDERGRAVADGLDPGAYEVRIVPESLGRNYVLEGPAEAKVRVPAGETARVTFRATAYSSIYAVTWNDAAGDARLGTAYTPISGIRVKVDAAADPSSPASRISSEDGTASFGRLVPGRYTISVDPATVPPGLVATTALSQTVEVAPGQEIVASFGFQGFGALEGQVLSVPRGGVRPSDPLGGIDVLLDGQPAGRTDDQGRFQLRVPAGGHTVTLDPGRLGAARYVVGGPLEIEVKPTETLVRHLVVEERGRIRGQLVRREPDGRVSPLREAGLIIEFSGGDPPFVYADENGAFVFERLPVGQYTLKVDPASVPAGHRLHPGSAEIRVDLRSGEDKTVEVLVTR